MPHVVDLNAYRKTHRQSRAVIAKAKVRLRTLDPRKCRLPPSVEQELSEQYIAIYAGQTTWLAQDRAGFIYEVTVTKTDFNTYDYEAVKVDSVQQTPAPAA